MAGLGIAKADQEAPQLRPFQKNVMSKIYRRNMELKRILRNIKRKREIKKICKANRYFCPDCIYHEHVWDGLRFLGTKCRLEDE